MTRPIKFRAWDWEKMTPSFGIFDWFDDNWRIYIPNFWRIYDNNIMQFTGLLDKNWKEIYEGDILWTSISDCYAWPIFWDDKKAGFHTELDLPVSCIEVIWNLYENPELLN